MINKITLIGLGILVLIVISGCSQEEEEMKMCEFTIEAHYGDFVTTGNQSFYVNQHPKLTLYFPKYQENVYWFDEEVNQII